MYSVRRCRLGKTSAAVPPSANLSPPLYVYSPILSIESSGQAVQSGISAVATILTYYMLLGYIDKCASSVDHIQKHLDSHTQAMPITQTPSFIIKFSHRNGQHFKQTAQQRQCDEQRPCCDRSRTTSLYMGREDDQRSSDPRSVSLAGAGPERSETPADKRA
jgi:hypothetical protein